MELWYKNTKNAEKGFKLWGLSEEIFFLPDYNGKYPATAYMYDMNLTPCLIPNVVGYESVFGNGSNSEKILIKRENEKSVSYTQGNVKRVVRFDGNSVVVLNGKNEVVDLGYLSSFQNEKFKQSLTKNALDELLEFKQQCVLDSASNLSMEQNDATEENQDVLDNDSAVYDDFFDE